MKRNQLNTLKILILSICALTLILALNTHAAEKCKDNPGLDKDKYGLYNCYTNTYFSNEADPNVNKVCVDKTLYWTFFGKPDDTVTVKFSPKYGCQGTAPGDDALTKKIGPEGSASLKLKIKAGKEDKCYYYEITCSAMAYSKESNTKAGDPIIEVPPR